MISSEYPENNYIAPVENKNNQRHHINPGFLGTENAWAINTTFTNRTDGDISILWFTPNTVSYNSTVDDPFFSLAQTTHFRGLSFTGSSS
jgi:hypothetical protein